MLEKKINRLLKISEGTRPGKRLTPEEVKEIEENNPIIPVMKKKQADDAAVKTGKIKRN
jgi:hypothetical protein